MEKLTLKFDCLINMAMFSKSLSAGYLMNTNNFTLSGKFNEQEVELALSKYEAMLVECPDKISTYEGN
jgi:translation initiation factor 2 beta subunit (eIF-2beta)/eIF-5